MVPEPYLLPTFGFDSTPEVVAIKPFEGLLADP